MGNTMFEQLKSSSVVDAATRIAPHVKRTRLVRNETLSRIAGGDVFLKLENEQITGSFKLRGALNALSTLPDRTKAHGVVTSSAGNHGMGVAYAAKTIGIKLRFDDFRIATRDLTLAAHTFDAREIRRAAGSCLKRVDLTRRLRLLGVRASALARLADLVAPLAAEALPPTVVVAREAAGEDSLPLFDERP